MYRFGHIIELVRRKPSGYTMRLLTIVTSTLNCEAAFRATASSIEAQSLKSIQWVVIDGGSTDGTVSAIKENSTVVDFWLSERDRGIYDAWNKAIPHIEGEWTLFLGAGDRLASNELLERLADDLPKIPEDVLLAYGKVLMVRDDDARYEVGEKDLGLYEFARPALPNHQGVLHRSSVFSLFSFDPSLAIAADSKMLLQILRRGGIFFLDYQIAKMDDGGVSNDYRKSFRTQREINQICKDLNIEQPLIELVKAYGIRSINYIAHMFATKRMEGIARELIDLRRRSR